VSHPFDRLRRGHWQLPELLAITPHIDAIETFNARCLVMAFNHTAWDFANRQLLPGTVGSDAHTIFEVGRARLRLPDFSDAASLKSALAQAERIVGLAPAWVHLFSRYASWVKSLHKVRPLDLPLDR
jgi:predicted metal-dependent phosphoesterase TrpH